MYFPESDTIVAKYAVYKEYCEWLDAFFCRNIDGSFYEKRLSTLLDIPPGIVSILLEGYVESGLLVERYTLPCGSDKCDSDVEVATNLLGSEILSFFAYCDNCQNEFEVGHIDSYSKSYSLAPDSREKFSHANISNRFIESIKVLEPGRPHALQYQSLVSEVLQWVFEGMLTDFVNEQRVDNGRGKIDIFARNIDRSGFFWDLSARHKIKCPHIFIECKNYSNDLKNEEYNQIFSRLNKNRGMMGVIICRTVDNRSDSIDRCSEQFKTEEKMVLVLDDDDLFELIKIRRNGNVDGVSRILCGHLNKIVLNNSRK